MLFSPPLKGAIFILKVELFVSSHCAKILLVIGVLDVIYIVSINLYKVFKKYFSPSAQSFE